MTCGTYSGSCDYVLTPTLGSFCKYVNVFHLLYIPSGALFRKGFGPVMGPFSSFVWDRVDSAALASLLVLLSPL